MASLINIRSSEGRKQKEWPSYLSLQHMNVASLCLQFELVPFWTNMLLNKHMVNCKHL